MPKAKKKKETEVIKLDFEIHSKMMSLINTATLDSLENVDFKKEIHNVTFAFIQLAIVWHYYSGGTRESFQQFVDQFLNYSDKHREDLVAMLDKFFDDYFGGVCNCEECKAEKEKPTKELN
jgi:hypothetical protein